MLVFISEGVNLETRRTKRPTQPSKIDRILTSETIKKYLYINIIQASKNINKKRGRGEFKYYNTRVTTTKQKTNKNILKHQKNRGIFLFYISIFNTSIFYKC